MLDLRTEVDGCGLSYVLDLRTEVDGCGLSYVLDCELRAVFLGRNTPRN